MHVTVQCDQEHNTLKVWIHDVSKPLGCCAVFCSLFYVFCFVNARDCQPYNDQSLRSHFPPF